MGQRHSINSLKVGRTYDSVPLRKLLAHPVDSVVFYGKFLAPAIRCIYSVYTGGSTKLQKNLLSRIANIIEKDFAKIDFERATKDALELREIVKEWKD